MATAEVDATGEPDEETTVDGSARTDGDCARRVVRGGSWRLPSGAARSAARNGKPAGKRYTDTGFRVVRELSPRTGEPAGS